MRPYMKNGNLKKPFDDIGMTNGKAMLYFILGLVVGFIFWI